MKTFNIYGYHGDLVPTPQFDMGMTFYFCKKLQDMGYEVNLYTDRSDRPNCVYTNGEDSAIVPHGSEVIIENAETGRFHVSDFGDVCTDMLRFVPFKNLAGITCGQYNKHRVDVEWPKEYPEKRTMFRAGYYPEKMWQFGSLNHDGIQEYRAGIELNRKLYFRGTVYGGRECVLILARTYSNEFDFKGARLPFEQFISELASYKMVLSLGMNIGGDICFKDIELLGLGIPLFRPKLRVEQHDPLIPNYHYISVDTELDPIYLVPLSQAQTAEDMIQRYREVVDDDDFLKEVARNGKEWYDRNIKYPNIVDNLIKLIDIENL